MNQSTLVHKSTIQTGCKINLFLRVGPRMPDGYHELQTFFLPLHTPHDTLEITRSEGNAASGIFVECNAPGIDPANNTLTKAYRLYAQSTGFTPNLHIRLTKGVPHGAGLGGGSADAAGLLLYLQKIAEEAGKSALSPETLNALAKKVGADVPFFLTNLPALAAGVGEKLTPASNPFAGWRVVLVCPDIAVSTAWAFSELDAHRAWNTETTHNREKFLGKMTNSLTSTGCHATTSFAHGMILENDFEEVVFRAFPSLHRIRDVLREKGAYASLLSGTGSSIFGLFENAAAAGNAALCLKQAGERVYMQTV